MNRDQRNSLWINPLLNRLKLVRTPPNSPDPNNSWKQIEVSQLPDRIGRMASEINEAAGYRLLETLFFLPPQKTVLCVLFDRKRSKHNMQIVIRDDEIAVLFSTAKVPVLGWERHWDRVIDPGEISDQQIQSWLSYLLSGLSREFRPDQSLPDTAAAESDLSAVFRKASA